MSEHGIAQAVDGIFGHWGEETADLYRTRGIGERFGWGSNPCLLVVDMCLAFTDPSYRFGADLSGALDAIERLLEVARRRGVLVIYTTTAYHPSMRDAGIFYEKMPAMAELVEGSPGVAIHPQIAPLADELVITKKVSSSFFGTNLTSILRVADVDTVVLTGVSTSGCIRAAAIDSASYGFRTIVPAEACGDRARGPHLANLFDIDAKYGDVLPLEEVLTTLEALAPAAERRRARL